MIPKCIAAVLIITIAAEHVAPQGCPTTPISSNPPLPEKADLAPVRQSIQAESNVPPYVISYLSRNLELLVDQAFAGYVSAGPVGPGEKFKTAGDYILRDPTVGKFLESKNWNVIAEVPPETAPQAGNGSALPLRISLLVPAEFRGVIHQAGRLRFECNSEKCLPSGGIFGK